MSVVYFKRGAVYFDRNSLVGKAFNVTIWISRRQKIGYSFPIFWSSKLDFMKNVINFTECERKFFMSIVLGKVSQLLCKSDCLCNCLDSWFLGFRVVIFIKVNFCGIAVSLSLLPGASSNFITFVIKEIVLDLLPPVGI